VTSSPRARKLPPQRGHAHGAACSTTSRGSVSGNGRRAGLRRVVSVGDAGCSGSAGAVAAISSSSSPSISSSCSSAPRSFSEDAPNRWRSSLARRSFNCSIRSACSCNPLRAAVNSAACSSSRCSNKLRNAVTLRGNVAGSSGVGMCESSTIDSRRSK
jgi:hypothetical protein